MPYLKIISQCRHALDRISAMLSLQPSIIADDPTALVLPTIKGDITLKDVCFSYPARPHVPVLEDVSLHIPAGTTFAIVGSSGSGE